jgi:hypothetical protein
MVVTAVPKRREREFPRFKIPLVAVLDKQRVTVCDWSVAGLGLSDVQLSQKPGDHLAIELLIETQGSTLRLPINVMVVWVDPAERRAGLQILDAAEKTAILAEFADLYLAGRLVQNDTGVLVLGNQVAHKEDGKASVVGTPSSAAAGEGLAGRIVGLAVFLVVGLAAFAFLSSIVYKRLFTFDAVSANVAAETTTVYQPRDGVVEFAALGDSVRQGDRIATIALDQAASGGQSTVDVLSPCDCHVVSVDHPAATFGRAGGRLVTLVGKEANLYVSVRLPFRRLANIADQPRISLTYLGGETAEDVGLISVPKVTEYTATQLEIHVQAGRQLDPSMVGQPVLATFDTAPWH